MRGNHTGGERIKALANSNGGKKIKAKNPISSFKRLLSYTVRSKFLLGMGTLGLGISSLTNVLIPYIVGKVMNEISNNNGEELNRYAVIFIFMSIVGGIFNYIKTYSFGLLSEKAIFAIRTELYDSILKKDTEYFDVNKSGELMSRITSDTSVIESAASDSFILLLKQITQFIGSIAFLLTIQWKLTLIIFGLAPSTAIFLVGFIKYFKKMKIEYQNTLSQANGFAAEAIGNIRVVKSFGTEKKESIQFKDSLTKTYLIGKKLTHYIGIFQGIFQTIAMSCIMIVLYKGGQYVMEGDMDIGDLSSFILYTITLTVSIVQSGNVVNRIITALGISERLFEIMDQEIKIQKGTKSLGELKGDIEFKNINFRYPTKNDVVVLQDINFKIQSGTTVALVGQSGSGKSSIVSLIEKFYNYASGQIIIDENEIREINSDWLHQNIGYVSQEPTLFSGTLLENIIYGVSHYTKEQLNEAIELANAKNFIDDKSLFPEGLQTIVGERGVKLSGGQKQRIAIARAVIKNPGILIFDEATSALDAESEYQVQYAIDQLVKKGDKTILIIAHRLSTIINSNNIIVLDHGKIVEQGTHQELLNQNSYYTKLIKRQLQGFDGQQISSSEDLDNGKNLDTSQNQNTESIILQEPENQDKEKLI